MLSQDDAPQPHGSEPAPGPRHIDLQPDKPAALRIELLEKASAPAAAFGGSPPLTPVGGSSALRAGSIAVGHAHATHDPESGIGATLRRRTDPVLMEGALHKMGAKAFLKAVVHKVGLANEHECVPRPPPLDRRSPSRVLFSCPGLLGPVRATV